LVLLAAAAWTGIVAPDLLRRPVRFDRREVIAVQSWEPKATGVPLIFFVVIIPLILLIPIFVLVPLVAMLTILEPAAHLQVYVLDQMIPLGKIGQDVVFADLDLLIHPIRVNDMFINQPVIVCLLDMVVDLFGIEVVGGVHQLAPDHFVAVLQSSFKEALVIGHRLFTRPVARNHERQPRPDRGGARELFAISVLAKLAVQPHFARR